MAVTRQPVQLRARRLGRHALLILCSLFFLGPFFWMLTTALKPAREVLVYPPILIPSSLHFENFSAAWNAAAFGTYLKNSLTVAGLDTVAQIISSALVAYGFARFRFRGRDALFAILLASMMIPWDVTMIPRYIEFKAFGWIDTLKPLIVPNFFGGPFFIFLLRQFLLGVPRELDEAARIDGANALTTFLLVIVPLLRPALIVVGVFEFFDAWNDYLGPLIFLNSDANYTLMLGIAQFHGMFTGQTNVQPLMAVTLIACIPPLIGFFLAQRHITQGIATTGIK
ncbi:MAG TPA: carbohydrate ABC transporter permease [Chloroflexota bacterium]|nr:carbohydrate ABC transporter permease [Chloroflexota bacterium]